MSKERQECLNCGKPAVTGGPVPLCGGCNAQAQEAKRGVKYDGNGQKQASDAQVP